MIVEYLNDKNLARISWSNKPTGANNLYFVVPNLNTFLKIYNSDTRWFGTIEGDDDLFCTCTEKNNLYCQISELSLKCGPYERIEAPEGTSKLIILRSDPIQSIRIAYRSKYDRDTRSCVLISNAEREEFFRNSKAQSGGAVTGYHYSIIPTSTYWNRWEQLFDPAVRQKQLREMYAKEALQKHAMDTARAQIETQLSIYQ